MAALLARIPKALPAAALAVLLAAGAAASQCSGSQACSAGAARDSILLQLSPAAQLSARRDPSEVDAHENAAEPGEDVDEDEDAAEPGEDVAGEMFSGVQRRRRAGNMGACRRRHSTPSSNPPEEAFEEWQCEGDMMVRVGRGPAPAPAQPHEGCGGSPGQGGSDACLCVFDIDRTLTGKQGDTRQCRRNKVLDLYDEAYGGGKATLSALTAEGISTTFCNRCHLGITSAGSGSGADSEWNRYLLDHVMRGEVHDAFTGANPGSQTWSYGTDVHSPYVLNQGNKIKQESVELVRQWYGRHGVCVDPSSVYFFGDRTENIEPFRQKGFNSREISCGSRDRRLYRGSGMVGYCGARPEEIQEVAGNVLCG